jgi:hypothetical protein
VAHAQIQAENPVSQKRDGQIPGFGGRKRGVGESGQAEWASSISMDSSAFTARSWCLAGGEVSATRGKRNVPDRRTLFDALEADASRNAFCDLSDLANEAAVETFFVNRLLEHLGYSDRQIKPKHSIDSLAVAKGHKKLKYKPDYVLVVNRLPRCVIDAKSPNENLDDWVEQCSGYCLALNRKHEKANPVRYFVLTNGNATKVYEWDKDEPILSMEFADFDWGKPSLKR